MYNKITLDNGVRIVYENIPYVRSVSMGIWVGTGSRFEKAEENGASHFIEHMVFKGTGRRTASELANAMDAIGGQINAFTTKDCTCFYGLVLDTHLPQLTDILCDMLFNSTFTRENVDNERSVIFEEIDMYADTPDDLVSERLFSAVYRGSSLARPILGTKKTLSGITGDTLRSYMAKHYCGSSIVVALSGSFTESDISDIADHFSSVTPDNGNITRRAKYKPCFTVKRRRIEQNHICLGFPALTSDAPERYAFQLMSSILGGGASSRLFQSVRENNGLCYTIATYTSAHKDTGLMSVYTALGKEAERQALRLIFDEIRRFKDGGVTEDELNCVREQMKANILISLESTGARMNRLGRCELGLGKVTEIDDIIAEYDVVTTDDIQRLANNYLDFEKLSFSVVGKTDTSDMYREFIGTCV